MSKGRVGLFVLSVGLALGFLFAPTAANAWWYQPYHYYHHYQYDRFPGGYPQPHDYTYDPYPYYRAYTYTHPPYYGSTGCFPSPSPYGDRWGLFVPSDQWKFY